MDRRADAVPCAAREAEFTLRYSSDVSLVSSVSTALDELMPEGRRWLVAVSGGSDSVAALRLMLADGRDVVVGHVDHRLRSSSSADAEFVEELCDSLGVRLTQTAVDVGAVAHERGWNVEDAARRVRYEFLHRAARDTGSDGIVVAHTRDDQAETFLWQAARGTAFPSGMPARRGIVVRPLLGTSRSELRDYLGGIGQAWREDETNLDVAGQDRAWLRHQVVPLLSGRYPRAPENLARTAEGLAHARDALMRIAAQRYGTRDMSVAALAGEPPGLQRAALAGLLEKAGITPSHEIIEEAIVAVADASTAKGSAPWRMDVGDGKALRVAYGRVAVAGSGDTGGTRRPVRVRNLGNLKEALGTGRPGLTPALRPEAVAALASEHGEALVLRQRRDGDRMRLPGGTKLVSDLLVDRKVPREERDELWVLAAGNEVFWVEGVAATPDVVDPAVKTDADWMLIALQQAELARAEGEVPVGAVVVMDGELLAAARNATEREDDPSAHAEVRALRDAGAAVGDRRLAGATLYVTLEPCPMCFGAVLQTRVGRVVYGSANLREGALGSVVDLRAGRFKRLPVVEGGLLAKESARLLSEFFEGRRGDTGTSG